MRTAKSWGVTVLCMWQSDRACRLSTLMKSRPASIACRRRKAALEALFARGKEDEAAEDAVLEQAKVIEAKRRAEASARRPAPVGAHLMYDRCTAWRFSSSGLL
jgi:hypothetical protein